MFTRRLKAGSMAQELSRTEYRILGVLFDLDEFFLNPQVRIHSETVPESFHNTEAEYIELNGDRSQNDPHPQVGSPV